MIPHLLRIVAMAAAAGTFAAMGYSVLCLWSAAAFLRETPPATETSPGAFPPVSILKPLKGIDPEMYESLRSHCRQNYPEYEIIFGVSDAADPAIKLVERLQLEFAGRNIRLVHCGEELGANVKVSNLIQMLPEAAHEILLVNDSDIQVGADYLRRVVTRLNEPNVGLVTCLYRGVPGPTLGSHLESLGISTDFCAGVLAARLVEGGIHFGLGSTLAFRRSDLKASGGFQPLVDYLADDYELGRRVAGRGREVKLAKEVVETHLPAYTLREFFAHQLRWMRTIREARPAGYAGLAFTFTLPWAVLALLCSAGALWAWYLLALAAAFRGAVALLVGKQVLCDARAARELALIPLRDCLAMLLWLGGFLGHTVSWRGERFTLKNGKLIRAGR